MASLNIGRARRARPGVTPLDNFCLEPRLFGEALSPMSTIEFLRIYSDTNDVSRFEVCTVDLDTNDYAPPAPALNTSLPHAADRCVFLELPVGWYGEWHPTPVRQWLVLMSGECEFETGDGERYRRRAGDVVMLDDRRGKGHQTKVIGDEPVRVAAIHFSKPFR